MFLIDWLRQYKELRREFSPEKELCESCETLKSQLALANQTNEKLIQRILEKSEPERVVAPVPVPFNKQTLPWAARRQILEAEDREKARALRNAPKPDSTTSVEELEKELGIVEHEREESSGGGGV